MHYITNFYAACFIFWSHLNEKSAYVIITHGLSHALFSLEGASDSEAVGEMSESDGK